jgi:hypothetical protein
LSGDQSQASTYHPSFAPKILLDIIAVRAIQRGSKAIKEEIMKIVISLVAAVVAFALSGDASMNFCPRNDDMLPWACS